MSTITSMDCLTQLLLSQSGPSPCRHTVQLFTLSWTPWGFFWSPYKMFLDWSSVRNLINPNYLASSQDLLGSHSISVFMPSSEISKLLAQKDVFSSDLFANWITLLHFPFLKFTREFCLAIPQGIVICSPEVSLASSACLPSFPKHQLSHLMLMVVITLTTSSSLFPCSSLMSITSCLVPLAFVSIKSDQQHLENPWTVLTMPHCLSIRWLDGWENPHWRQGNHAGFLKQGSPNSDSCLCIHWKYLWLKYSSFLLLQVSLRNWERQNNQNILFFLYDSISFSFLHFA